MNFHAVELPPWRPLRPRPPSRLRRSRPRRQSRRRRSRPRDAGAGRGRALVQAAPFSGGKYCFCVESSDDIREVDSISQKSSWVVEVKPK